MSVGRHELGEEFNPNPPTIPTLKTPLPYTISGVEGYIRPLSPCLTPANPSYSVLDIIQQLARCGGRVKVPRCLVVSYLISSLPHCSHVAPAAD